MSLCNYVFQRLISCLRFHLIKYKSFRNNMDEYVRSNDVYGLHWKFGVFYEVNQAFDTLHQINH